MQQKRLLLTFSILLAILLGVFVTNYTFIPEVSLAKEETPTAVQIENVINNSQAPSLLAASLNDPYQIANIAEAVNPAIVYIHVKWPAEQSSTPRVWSNDPFYDFFDFWFFQPFQQIPRERVSQGTGFIIEESGIIVTNQHVVGNRGENQEITVTLNSPEHKGDYKATILGADARLDLAVLKIENGNDQFPTVALGDSDQSRPGEWVIAIGNPYGKQFDHTVTVGVLSAKGREIAIRDPDTGTTRVYQNLMQTDAAINSGNSGGPLLNLEGKVIGINTAVHAQAQGIGFAIPINVAKEVLQELIETGEVKLPPKPWLGVWFTEITDEIAKQLRLPDTKGVVITDVINGGPAHQGGIRSRDIIRRCDDIDIQSSNDLTSAVAQYKPGDEVVITVLRDGRTLLLTITIGDTPEELRN